MRRRACLTPKKSALNTIVAFHLGLFLGWVIDFSRSYDFRKKKTKQKEKGLLISSIANGGPSVENRCS